MAPPLQRHPGVHRGDVRKAATEHDRIRIDEVDHVRERPGQPGYIAIDGGQGGRIAGRGPCSDVGSGEAGT